MGADCDRRGRRIGAKTMSEEAKVIEVDVAPLTGADRWLASVSERVAKTAGEYGLYDISNADEYRQAKRERAAVRRDIAEVDAERRSLTRSIEDAVRDFRDRAKDVLLPLTELDDGYKAKIDAYEDDVLRRRRRELEEFYSTAAPFMADGTGSPLVSFDLIARSYGNGQLGRKWFNMSTSADDARGQLVRALEDIREREAAIRESVEPSKVDMARSIFFDTLDVAGTIVEVNRRSEQERRLAELDREREELLKWQEEAMRQAEPEPTEPEPSEPEPSETELSEEQACEWVFAGYGTKEQAIAFASWCNANGVSRHVERSANGRQFRLVAR